MKQTLRWVGWLAVAMLAAAQMEAADSCDDNVVTLTERRSGDAVGIEAAIRDGMDVTITLEADLQNMTPSRPLPCTVDLSGRRTVELVTLRPSSPGAAYKYKYRFYFHHGGRQGKHNPATVYRLPYERTGSHRISQGYLGKFSHGPGSQSEHALDFRMKIGTTVCAARSGVVCGIRQDSTTGGPDAAYKPCANYVIIRHTDGTYAEYFHLLAGGVKVHMGEFVEAGQPIAASGNTGFSSEPHLHFSVFRVVDGKTRETLPVKFRIGDGKIAELREGETY